MSADILIIDDEADIRDLVAGILEDEGHQARTAANADAALQEIATRRPSLVTIARCDQRATCRFTCGDDFRPWQYRNRRIRDQARGL